jgi:hypothetical protein
MLLPAFGTAENVGFFLVAIMVVVMMVGAMARVEARHGGLPRHEA